MYQYNSQMTKASRITSVFSSKTTNLAQRLYLIYDLSMRKH